MDNNIMVYGQGIIAILAGFIVEGAKKAGMPTKYAMLASAGVGVLLGIASVLVMPEVDWATGIFGGLFAGAAASGFYGGTKKMLK